MGYLRRIGEALSRPAAAVCVSVAILAVGQSRAWAQGAAGEQGKLSPSDPADLNRLGWSVSISGDTAIVGAPLKNDFGTYSGAAYIFVRDSAGTNAWTEVRKLTASDAALNNQFGSSVSISGDTAIVGSVGDDDLGEFTGSAYIFERNHGGTNAWGEVTKLTASTAARFSYFGGSVSISGDTAIVGAQANDNPGGQPGAAFIYGRNHGGENAWGELARLSASDAASGGAAFGFSVSINGDTAIIGAPFDENPALSFGGLQSGSAYIFARDHGGTDAWGEVKKLTASDPSIGDVFGWAVSIDGSTAIAGAPSDEGRASNAGAAYIFERDQGGTDAWGEVLKLTANDAAREDTFGISVSISGDTAVVGAQNDDEKGGIGSRSGSAYIYSRQAGGANRWGQLHKLAAGDGGEFDQFGSSVLISGSTAVVGAPRLDNRPGAAYVCQLDALNSVSGACRRVVPTVNHLITMTRATTSCCAASEFRIIATFTNTSAVPIRDPFFEVIQLTGGNFSGPPNVLQNADGGPGGVGATLTPDVGEALAPGQSTTVTFVIRLLTMRPFGFQVNVRGEAVQ